MPGTWPCALVTRATSAAILPRNSAAMALPSMMVAVMSSASRPRRRAPDRSESNALAASLATSVPAPPPASGHRRNGEPLDAGRGAGTSATSRGRTPMALAISRISASLASPSVGAARTRAFNTLRPSASCSMPSMASRPPLGVSRTSSVTPCAPCRSTAARRPKAQNAVGEIA